MWIKNATQKFLMTENGIIRNANMILPRCSVCLYLNRIQIFGKLWSTRRNERDFSLTCFAGNSSLWAFPLHWTAALLACAHTWTVRKHNKKHTYSPCFPSEITQREREALSHYSQMKILSESMFPTIYVFSFHRWAPCKECVAVHYTMKSSTNI